MFDIFAFGSKVEYVDYVSTNTFATVIIGLCTILTIILVPMFQGIYKKLDKIIDQQQNHTEQLVELKTLISLDLIRKGVSFEEQEQAVQKAQEKQQSQ